MLARPSTARRPLGRTVTETEEIASAVRSHHTAITERGQFHQALLVQSGTSYSPNMQASLENLATTLAPAGLSTPDALHRAYGRIYAGLVMQAQTLAYIDTFWVLALIAPCLFPLVLLLKKVEPGKATVAH
jgi:MFS transporter, DHA2 family, multidrug resistance protein